MKVLYRALGAEILKLKRTMALWLIVIGPLAAVVFTSLIFISGNDQIISADDDPWMLVTRNGFGVWAIMLLTPFIALESALLGQQEHNNQGWKHIYALPVPRWATYIAKEIIALGVFALCQLALVIEVLLLAAFVKFFKIGPPMNYSAPLPWSLILRTALFINVAGWFMISIHTWLGLCWSSFVGAMSAGAAATVVGLMVGSTELGWYFPWSMPRMALTALNPGMVDSGLLIAMLGLSVAGALAVTLFGTWNLSRSDVG
jgi:hypothetical protein